MVTDFITQNKFSTKLSQPAIFITPMDGRSVFSILVKLLTQYPLNLPLTQAEQLAPILRDFWANIADGDQLLEYPEFPPLVNQYIQSYGAIAADGTPTFIDNHATLLLN